MVQIHWKLPFSSSGTANIQALTCEARKPEGNSGTFYLAKLLFHSHSRRVLASQILVYWIRIGRRVVAYSKPIWPGSAIMRLPVSLFQWLLIERRWQWNIPWINSSYFRLRGPPPPPPLLPIMFRLTTSQNSWSDHLIRNWSRVALEEERTIYKYLSLHRVLQVNPEDESVSATKKYSQLSLCRSVDGQVKACWTECWLWLAIRIEV